MMGALLIAAVLAAAIILFGQATGHLVSSPKTRALTRLVASHRFKGPLQQAESVGSIFSLYGLDASGRRDAKTSEIQERRNQLLFDAVDFDVRYGKYHAGISAHDILKHEIGEYLDD